MRTTGSLLLVGVVLLAACGGTGGVPPAAPALEGQAALDAQATLAVWSAQGTAVAVETARAVQATAEAAAAQARATADAQAAQATATGVAVQATAQAAAWAEATATTTATSDAAIQAFMEEIGRAHV